MKLKKVKYFLAGASSALILGASSLVYAAGGFQNINVIFNQVKLAINGQQINETTLTHNGATYIPLRGVVEKLGYSINYDQYTGIANITNGTTNPTPSGTTYSFMNQIYLVL